ncbi:hypothetical protein DYB28_000167 [Aphanomyces astaci]|uniref:Protein kinase domain-containing protein n=1 Tax=Aphanomyces astaci TaxID=112090 RepID=A0A9X8DIP7_APHAT|nr:hypothetical protein DYB28_000167 [Aphanomyces astaci]
MTDHVIRPGRLRVISMLQDGVLDPHVTHSFPAFIAPDGKSAEAYLKTQPMGSYLFVHNLTQSASWWRPTDLSLSIMVKFRTRVQVAHVPMRFKSSKTWFTPLRRSAYIEWSKTSQHVHKAYVDPTMYPTLRAYWAEYMLYVGEKVSEICQDPSLNENWTPSSSLPSTIRVLGYPVGDGIHVDIMQARPISIRFNFARCSIDVYFNRRRLSLDGSLWRIKYPWNMTFVLVFLSWFHVSLLHLAIRFATIKGMALGQSPFRGVPPKSSESMIMPRGSSFKYIPSCHESVEDEHVEEELLQALMDRAQLYQNTTKESPLTDVLQILLRVPPDQSTSPKLLELRLDILGFLVQLQSVDVHAARWFTRPTTDRAVEYVVHLTCQYELGSIGSEKIAQVVRGAVGANPDVAYVLRLVHGLLSVPSFQHAFVNNQGASALWSRSASLMAEVHAAVRAQSRGQCLLYAPDTTTTHGTALVPLQATGQLGTHDHTVAGAHIQWQAGVQLALHGISFVRDEFVRRYPHSKQPHNDLCADDTDDDATPHVFPRLDTPSFRAPPLTPCKACQCPQKLAALQFLRCIDKLHEKSSAAALAGKADAACVHQLTSELAFWASQADDTCWKRMFLNQWLRKFNGWARQDDDDSLSATVDLTWLATVVGRVHMLNINDGVVQVRIFCQLLASLPGLLDEKHSDSDDGKAVAATIVEIVSGIVTTASVTSSLIFAVLELWRLLLLSTGWHATKLKLLHVLVHYTPLYSAASAARNAMEEAGSPHAVYYAKWLAVSLGFLGSRRAETTMYPCTIGATWSKLLYKMGCPVPAGGFEDMHTTTSHRFLEVVPSTDQLHHDATNEHGLRSWKAYLECLHQCTPARTIPRELVARQFSRFLECYYFHDRDTPLVWDCLVTVTTYAATAWADLDEFVLLQLFGFHSADGGSTLASRPCKSSATPHASSLLVLARTEDASSIPLLQLHKLMPLQQLATPEQSLLECSHSHPMDNFKFWCSSDMYIAFVLHVFNLLVTTADNQSLNPTYCGRFGGSHDVDILYWLQMHFDSPKCKHLVAQLTRRLADQEPHTSRRQSKLRLVKLAAPSLSDRVMFFRGFDPPRQGAFGTVYRCTSDMPIIRLHSPNTRESIALKVLPPQKLPQDRSILYCVTVMEHLRGNAAAVQLYDYGLSQDGYFIAMEYAECSLKGWRDNATTVTLDTVLAVFSKVRSPRNVSVVDMCHAEEWPTLFAHLTCSTAPVLMDKHVAMLHEAVARLSPQRAIDDDVLTHQVATVSDLLSFILVRDPLRRPSLDSIQRKLLDFRLPRLVEMTRSIHPQHLTAPDAMARQVRLLDVHHPAPTGKLRLSRRLYLGWQPVWNGEHGVVITHTPPTHRNRSSRPRTVFVTPHHSLPFDQQEVKYTQDLFRHAKAICSMLWDLYVSDRVVLLDVPSKPVMRALMPVLYVYHMLFFGPSCFELVKQLWKPHETILIPSTAHLTSLLCWEEKRCITTQSAQHTNTYQVGGGGGGTPETLFRRAGALDDVGVVPRDVDGLGPVDNDPLRALSFLAMMVWIWWFLARKRHSDLLRVRRTRRSSSPLSEMSVSTGTMAGPTGVRALCPNGMGGAPEGEASTVGRSKAGWVIMGLGICVLLSSDREGRRAKKRNESMKSN